MIQIELRKNREGLLTGYEVLGHAEDAPMGNSVLCAWVSAVTQMALIGLEQEIKHAVSYETDETKGLLKVRLKGTADSRTQDILGTMERTLRQVAAAHPKEVEIREHRG
jgi:uncharacterized protein YsxB (DUF464 family)